MTGPAESRPQIVLDTWDDLLGQRAGSAWFSPCKRYRYLLTRAWDHVPQAMTWIMLNPSAADAFMDDPTIRRCVSFARREHFGSIRVVNLFALRATDPRELLACDDPVGPDNDRFLRDHGTATLAVAAWGAGGALAGRGRDVGRMLAGAGAKLLCLGVTADGHPRHPLYVRADAPLLPWEPPP